MKIKFGTKINVFIIRGSGHLISNKIRDSNVLFK